jgi:hypothetical protein
MAKIGVVRKWMRGRRLAKRPVLGHIVAKAVIVFKNGRLAREGSGVDLAFEEIELKLLNSQEVSWAGPTITLKPCRDGAQRWCDRTYVWAKRDR